MGRPPQQCCQVVVVVGAAARGEPALVGLGVVGAVVDWVAGLAVEGELAVEAGPAERAGWPAALAEGPGL